MILIFKERIDYITYVKLKNKNVNNLSQCWAIELSLVKSLDKLILTILVKGAPAVVEKKIALRPKSQTKLQEFGWADFNIDNGV